MNAIRYFAISIALIIPEFSSADNLYHSKDIGVVVCNEKKITAEMSDVVKHPGILSDSAFDRLWTEGKCLPLSPKVAFKVLRFETFSVPAGVQKVAYALLSNTIPNSPPIYFYMMQDDIDQLTDRHAP